MTTTILGDVVENVAGDDALVEVVMPTGADPHTYEASARQAARLRDADLVVANGVDLEEGLLDTIESAEDDGVRVLRVGDLLGPEPFTGVDGEHAEADADDHDHDGGLDPHVWMDPVRMIEAAGLVAAELAAVAEGDFAARAEAYQERLAELDREIAALIETIPADRRALVTNHFAYGYYADRYGLEMLGTVIPAATTASETSARQYAELLELIEREDVPAIFASTTEPTRLAEAIAADAGRGVQVIELPTGSLGEEGSETDTYIGMMRTTTRLIVEGLTG
ncbi:MAG: metal ABC transporter substrate-binding protein [Acidimicrobiia bacterium]|nr:metal ABC transporter substrate-binding protein [Acidimicrobiia bacterium]